MGIRLYYYDVPDIGLGGGVYGGKGFASCSRAKCKSTTALSMGDLTT